jgi:hypothetical protein
MLTAREAFRIGFLWRCADEGLLPKEAAQRVREALNLLDQIKVAESQALKTINRLGRPIELIDRISRISELPIWNNFQARPTIADALTPSTQILSKLLGNIGGELWHEATEDIVDEKLIQKKELLDELRYWTEREKRLQKKEKTK